MKGEPRQVCPLTRSAGCIACFVGHRYARYTIMKVLIKRTSKITLTGIQTSQTSPSFIVEPGLSWGLSGRNIENVYHLVFASSLNAKGKRHAKGGREHPWDFTPGNVSNSRTTFC